MRDVGRTVGLDADKPAAGGTGEARAVPGVTGPDGDIPETAAREEG